MAITPMMAAALSGLQTAQTGLTTVSNNITNVNTPGYAREIVDQSPQVSGGVGTGVRVNDVRRVSNQYLESANYNASSTAGSASIMATMLDQAQAAFGDPSQSGAYLNQLSSVFSDFSAAAINPASSLSRSQTLNDLNSFLDSTQNVAGTLQTLNTQADGQINNDVTQINQLLTQIGALNQQIEKGVATNANVAGSQDAQSQLLGQLSSLMTISVNTQADGTMVVRSSNGQLLAGEGGSTATLSYTPSVTGLGTISATAAGTNRPTTLQIGDGELQGLLTLRNDTIPGLQQQLSSYVTGAVTAINAAHNANSASPPPQTLSGRNTGLDLPTIVSDFSGKTNIAIVDSTGAVAQQVAIDFSAGTMSVNGGAATAFTPATFLASLNTALGGTGTASFANGALSVSATASGNGVAIADDATTPARDGGQGFSQFFGLNDLVTSTEITNYNTGLKASDLAGFTPGGQITFQIANPQGGTTATISVAAPPAGSTMQDLLDTLNAPIGGMGQYGSFSLDANGAMTFTPSSAGSSLAVMTDTTQRGAGGPSMSQLFGLGASQQAGRASSFQVRSDIAANPMNMALAKLDLSAASGQPAIAIGDGSGATALAQAANAAIGFAAAGGMPAMSTSIVQYAATLGGSIGQRAAAADTAKTSAIAIQTEAQTRLQSTEGVNLDEELVNLTTFQQAYNASARLVQASKAMIDTLLDIVP
ncbi:MAG TPA: flagellar hook-associated protein FlgK [Caulobacteraceae bacterium]|nr:flagellar hook-associated protein FlgK [Caulobacteraceae bacterium]